MIITKLLSNGDVQISEHFKLSEFKSPGTDTVKYDTDILAMLEKVRAHFGGVSKINSGYRTPAYNKRVGGSLHSAHMEGRAVDLEQHDHTGALVPSKSVCLFLEEIGWTGGIGYMNTATHFDTKFLGSRIDETRPGTTTKWYVVRTTYAAYWGYKTRTVIAPAVNLRSGPGTNYPVVGRKTIGNKVTVYATAKDSRGRTWAKISFISNRWIAYWLTK